MHIHVYVLNAFAKGELRREYGSYACLLYALSMDAISLTLVRNVKKEPRGVAQMFMCVPADITFATARVLKQLQKNGQYVQLSRMRPP
jgi:hypothetical protein